VSEYQYYEFRAVDRALTPDEMAALRRITSRAEITPYSLTNEYHFGDFKGDPRELVERYFDAFVYFANWGTRQAMVRVSAEAVRPAVVSVYKGECLAIRHRSGHVVLDFGSPPDVEPEWEAGDEDWMPAMLALRQDILQGDYRALYLAWLAGLVEADEDGEEPPVPAGLGKLSPALEQLADFLYLDPHLVAVAAEASVAPAPPPSAKELAAWVAKLPAAEKDRALLRAAQGQGAQVGVELQRRYRAEAVPATAAEAGARTVGELLQAAQERAEGAQRRKAAAKARDAERAAREAAATRERKLDLLSGQEDDIWLKVERAVSHKLPKEYDKAVSLLLDLRDLAKRAGEEAAFGRRAQALRELHGRKPGLLQRLDKAGLP